MNGTIEMKKSELENCSKAVSQIIEGLKAEETKKKLEVLNQIRNLPDISGDEDIKQMKEYRQYRELLKSMHKATAKTIIHILDTEKSFSGDPEISFNYTEMVELQQAAECITLLPNAFIGGPIKSAINNRSVKVKLFALDYFDSLPREVRYSDVFPPNFTKLMAKLRAQLKA
jgi:hypothetical protein